MRHASRIAESVCPFCTGVNAKKGMLSQHFVTRVVPPLAGLNTDILPRGGGGGKIGVWKKRGGGAKLGYGKRGGGGRKAQPNIT